MKSVERSYINKKKNFIRPALHLRLTQCPLYYKLTSSIEALYFIPILPNFSYMTKFTGTLSSRVVKSCGSKIGFSSASTFLSNLSRRKSTKLDHEMFQLCPCTLVFGYKIFGNFESGLGHIFFYLLDYVTLIRILKCGDREKKIKIELEPKTHRIIATLEVLFLLMTCMAIYNDICVKKIK